MITALTRKWRTAAAASGGSASRRKMSVRRPRMRKDRQPCQPTLGGRRIAVIERGLGTLQVPGEQIGDDHAIARVLSVAAQPGEHGARLA